MKHEIPPDSPPTFSMILKPELQKKLRSIQTFLQSEGLNVSDGLVFRALLLSTEEDSALVGVIREQKAKERAERNELRTATFAEKKTAKGKSSK